MRAGFLGPTVFDRGIGSQWFNQSTTVDLALWRSCSIESRGVIPAGHSVGHDHLETAADLRIRARALRYLESVDTIDNVVYFHTSGRRRNGVPVETPGIQSVIASHDEVGLVVESDLAS